MHRTLASVDSAEFETNGGSGPAPGIGRVSSSPADFPGPAPAENGTLKILHDRLAIKTLCEFDVIDITDEVQSMVKTSGVKEGYALVYSPHTTCALVLNEKESGLLADLSGILSRLVPPAKGYLHDDFDVRTENMHPEETRNAHAHLRQLLAAKSSEYIPVSKGCLQLGRWQRIMFVEFDCARDREALIQVCGI